jgi:RNA polymerase sigma-70 factor (ECF subfamily)
MTQRRARGSDARHGELLAILPNVRRFALSLAGNLADADDLLQSTVERLLDRGLPADAELLPWAFKVCRNLWIDEYRSRAVRRKAALDPALQDLQAGSGSGDASSGLVLREVREALVTIAPEQRAVLELVAVEGHTYRQAAGILDVPIGTVMSRLARARAALAGKLKP